MKKQISILFLLCAAAFCSYAQTNTGTAIGLPSKQLKGSTTLKLDGFFYETAAGKVFFAQQMTKPQITGRLRTEIKAADGRMVKVSVVPQGNNFNVSLSADKNDDIIKWGVQIDALADEYYTGLMERVVDGPQQASWKPGITEAMNLRGQKVDMILKPTTSVYAPYYLSSRGYAVFVRGNWPGFYDFASSVPDKVKIEFEGPSFEFKIYTSKDPAALITAHVKDDGLPFLPPKWMFTPWRWRDEHTQRTTYYDGTPVTGPFNSEIMEDVLMMRAYGIPNGVYWIDRPWGTGFWGYDDFDIDPRRLPHFEPMVKWLNAHDQQMVLWIGPFFQGKMAGEATAKGYTLAGQVRPGNGNNFPMVDMSNPQAKAYWQAGVEKLVKAGVAGFKLDRAEENIPDGGPHKIFDGRSLREQRNNYPTMYIKATYDIVSKHRGKDFMLMPRAAYSGANPYAVFWGGDVGGTQEGLRASIIAMQRSAVMGYPNWGADTCGYNQQLMEQEVCGRWLAFSAFNPIMEVGPTKNAAFWNFPRDPKNPTYDAVLIAMWRMYARLHQRLVDYGYAHAQEASKTGMPIVRPLFMADPKAKAAWENWWTYQYGKDILVSPVWEKGVREQQVYLPAGNKWQDAWDKTKVYSGGQTIKVKAEPHQIPIFVRVGSNIDLGDLENEWKESMAIAQKRPDLKALETEVNDWFSKNK